MTVLYKTDTDKANTVTAVKKVEHDLSLYLCMYYSGLTVSHSEMLPCQLVSKVWIVTPVDVLRVLCYCIAFNFCSGNWWKERRWLNWCTTIATILVHHWWAAFPFMPIQNENPVGNTVTLNKLSSLVKLLGGDWFKMSFGALIHTLLMGVVKQWIDTNTMLLKVFKKKNNNL